MRNLIVFFLLSILSFGQVPQGMSHRGTVYNTNGTIVSNTLVSISIRILDGSSSGTEVYKELHTNIQTNNNGQYSLVIGQGNPQNGTFDAIDWSTGNKFLEIAIDPTSGTGINYSLVGSSQLMSVPYALFAGKSDSSIEVLGTIQDLKNYSFLEDKKIVYGIVGLDGSGNEIKNNTGNLQQIVIILKKSNVIKKAEIEKQKTEIGNESS